MPQAPWLETIPVSQSCFQMISHLAVEMAIITGWPFWHTNFNYAHDIKSKCHSGRAQHAAPNKKGTVGRRKTGGAGRQSVVPAARGPRYCSRLVAGQEARPSSQSKLE
jgi:hypothetical protein